MASRLYPNASQLTVPKALNEEKLSPDLDRMRIGEHLLAGFLMDGKIRGVTRQGEVYTHLVDKTLLQDFLQRLKNNTVIGTGRRPVD